MSPGADALAFWASHLDDTAGLWEVAQIQYDRDDTMRMLAEQAATLLARGKPVLDATWIARAQFDVEDQLRHVAHVAAGDPATANLLLTSKVFVLTELYFDLRRAWTPPPKQRLAQLAVRDPEFAALVRRFYADPTVAQLSLATELVRYVFDHAG